jgi:hypothetical protein
VGGGNHLNYKLKCWNVLLFVLTYGYICSDKLESTIEMCDKLHEKWQQHQKQFFSSSLADMEHRIMLAEDSIKKNKQTSSVNDVEPSYAHRSLR